MKLRVVGMLVLLLSILAACGNDGASSTGNGTNDPDKVLLRLNVPQGDTFQVLTIQENTATASMLGSSTPISTTTRTSLDYTVKEIDAEGLTHLNVQYTSAVVTATMDGEVHTADLFNPQAPTTGSIEGQLKTGDLESPETEASPEDLDYNPARISEGALMVQMFRDTPLTMIYSPNGTLVRVPELEEFLEMAMSGMQDEDINPAMLSMMEGYMEQYKDNLNNSSHMPFEYPDHAVGIGESWTTTRTMNMQFVQMELVVTYTLLERQDGVAVIDVKGQGVVESGSAEQMQEFFQMIEAENSSGTDEEMNMDIEFTITQDGLLRVDEATGWPIFMRITQDVDGTMSMKFGEESFDTDMDQTSIITNETIR